MSNLLSSLVHSTTALRVFERGLSITQNNIANANTPGYVKQTMHPGALPFDPEEGLSGGVWAGNTRSSRNGYMEQQVRQQTAAAGYSDQLVQSLAAVENAVAISGADGITGALGSLFQSFSAWGQDPNNQSMREGVLRGAAGVASAFRNTASELSAVRQQTDVNLRNTVDQINTLATRIQEYNRVRQHGAQTDAGVDANLHAALEELSDLVNITVLYQEDSTVTVLAGEQGLLVEGETSYQFSIGFGTTSEPPPVFPDAVGPATVLDQDGRDISRLLTGGRLGALLQVRNETLPSLIGDSQNLGSLNHLAATLVAEVNSIMAAGQVSDGIPGATALFLVDPSDPTAAARSLAVDAAATADSLPAIAPGPPPISNGTALQLAGLSNQRLAALDGVTLAQFYGRTAASVGSQVAEARTDSDQKTGFVEQARAMRDEISGVSLDEEALRLLEYQRAYQATAKVVMTLAELTEEVMSILR